MNNQTKKAHDMAAANSAAESSSTGSPNEPTATETTQRADAQVRLLGILTDAVVESFRTGGSDFTRDG